MRADRVIDLLKELDPSTDIVSDDGDLLFLNEDGIWVAIDIGYAKG